MNDEGVGGLDEAVDHATVDKVDADAIDPNTDRRGMQGIDSEIDYVDGVDRYVEDLFF